MRYFRRHAATPRNHIPPREDDQLMRESGHIDREAVLLHQVHPVKLAFDISAFAASTVLLWQHHLRPGLIVRFGLPMIGSAAVLRWADLDILREHPRGRYVLDNMPPAAQAVRLVSDAITAYGAWQRRPTVIATGLGIIAAGWSYGARHLIAGFGAD